jgi:hypothetical protein
LKQSNKNSIYELFDISTSVFRRMLLVALTIASSMVGACLDNCNAVLHGTSKSNIQNLWRVQNSLARIVTGTRRSDHITPVLARLHWLKIADRIDYKVALLIFKVYTSPKPDCLFDLIRFHTSVR